MIGRKGTKMKKKIAIVLCGSGYKDGSEIRESVGVLWALSQAGAEVQCFAPNDKQWDVVNCLTGEVVSGETRNMLVESARIARGNVLPLEKLRETYSKYDGIVLPGGFGAAKNLCSFAREGSKGSVRPELTEILLGMHRAGKPIGAVCIAPALLALAFKGTKLELTLGATGEASAEIEKLGHKHVVCRPNEAHYDTAHKIATTPAYMYDDGVLHEIFEGIRKVVERVVQ